MNPLTYRNWFLKLHLVLQTSATIDFGKAIHYKIIMKEALAMSQILIHRYGKLGAIGYDSGTLTRAKATGFDQDARANCNQRPAMFWSWNGSRTPTAPPAAWRPLPTDQPCPLLKLPRTSPLQVDSLTILLPSSYWPIVFVGHCPPCKFLPP